jgi:hypothetical protein
MLRGKAGIEREPLEMLGNMLHCVTWNKTGTGLRATYRKSLI